MRGPPLPLAVAANGWRILCLGDLCISRVPVPPSRMPWRRRRARVVGSLYSSPAAAASSSPPATVRGLGVFMCLEELQFILPLRRGRRPRCGASASFFAVVRARRGRDRRLPVREDATSRSKVSAGSRRERRRCSGGASPVRVGGCRVSGSQGCGCNFHFLWVLYCFSWLIRAVVVS